MQLVYGTKLFRLPAWLVCETWCLLCSVCTQSTCMLGLKLEVMGH